MKQTMRSKLLSGYLAALLAAILPYAAFAQADKGTILGSVQDASGAPASDTEVKVTEINTNIVHSARTNDTGNFTFPLLDPGTYIVSTERAGFNKASRSGVQLDANSTIRVDFALQVGSVTETIDVSASAAILQTDRADLGAKIETQTLANMPLTSNRNHQRLLGW